MPFPQYHLIFLLFKIESKALNEKPIMEFPETTGSNVLDLYFNSLTLIQ